MTDGAIFTKRWDVDPEATGPRLAVKCSIAVAGHVAHAGCAALRDHGEPATEDAPVVRTAREQGAVLIGHTVMSELGLNATGVNAVFGTPPNPFDPERIPGGSSSGSAAALARGLADVAYGTDAGGSCRMPPACCGVVGLKTTAGRLPLDGIGVLSPTLDVVGPLAPDVAGCTLGMQLMEPGFAPAGAPATRVARLRVEAEPWIDEAIDRSLHEAGFEVVVLAPDDLGGWGDATRAGGILLVVEGYQQHRELLERHPGGLQPASRDKLEVGLHVADRVDDAHAARERFRAALDEVLSDVDLLALPTIGITPPRVADAGLEADIAMSRYTIPFNLSGHPALAVPIPTTGTFPASLQLVAPWGGEELLLASGQVVEAAARA